MSDREFFKKKGKESKMKILKGFIGLLLISVFFYFCTGFLLELWWYRSLNLGKFFLLRESYAYSIYIIATGVVAGSVYVNFVTIPYLLTYGASERNLGVLSALQTRKKLLGIFSVIFSHRALNFTSLK